MKALLIHGVGFHEAEKDLTTWPKEWLRAIEESTRARGIHLPIENPLGDDLTPSPISDPGILYYEDVIRKYPEPNPAEYAWAVSRLIGSGIGTTIGGWFGFRGESRDARTNETLWKAEQVAQWVINKEMRNELIARVIGQIEEKDPDLIIAHSYGGLILYDACVWGDWNLLKNRWLVTMGTQIGNSFVRQQYKRQDAMPCRHWFNLYNKYDPVFVADMNHIRGSNYTQIRAFHSRDRQTAHSGVGYLGYEDTASTAWSAIAQGARWRKQRNRGIKLARRIIKKPKRRALLVGIDRFAHPRISNLEGCVNDTYLLSSALQDAGFDAGEIRMLHNERATKEAILERMEWLVDGIEDGSERVISFSTHGHQTALYDFTGEPDYLDEILVTHDYDFEADSGIRDDDIYNFYSNLPYKSNLLMVFDICFSGGIYRDTSTLVRSITSPSDIAHRSKVWNSKTRMWQQRSFPAINSQAFPEGKGKRQREASRAKREQFFGHNGAVRRLGRASRLRDLSHEEQQELIKTLDQNPSAKPAKFPGPYLPLIYMACREGEPAAEYRHGSSSYGAFTYSLVQAMRDEVAKGTKPTFTVLLDKCREKLREMEFSQEPDLLGPTAKKNSEVPLFR